MTNQQFKDKIQAALEAVQAGGPAGKLKGQVEGSGDGRAGVLLRRLRAKPRRPPLVRSSVGPRSWLPPED
jgi:hypothetical protein